MKHKAHKIIIVEDDQGLQKLIRKKLELDGFETKIYANGATLKKDIEQISKETIILLDYILPDINGIDLIEELNLEERGIPFIIMTGHGDERIAVEMMKLGARDYLVKESNFIELLVPVINQTVRELSLEEKLTQAVNTSREKDSIMMMQSRQASMSELLSNIALNWQNALSTIDNDAETIHEFGNIDVKKKVTDIKSITENLRKQLNNLQKFFNPNLEKSLFYLDDAIKKAFDLMQSTLNNQKINTELSLLDQTQILGYENDHVQIIVNIINNSKEAHLKNNTSTPFIKATLDQNSDQYIITISDNAGGIDENIINKIYDPYFTTKTKGEGSGLGLYISKSFIEKKMDGKIYSRNIHNGMETKIEIKK